MNIIVIGNGGREHAIAWKLSQSPAVETIVCVPGNGGTALEKKCKNIEPVYGEESGTSGFAKACVQIAQEEGCSLCVVGPENPLAEGIADIFWENNIPVVGPKKAAAQLEASKDFAKTFMKKYGVASAKSKTFTDISMALDYVEAEGAPIVVKADGLAAGKGVIVAKTVQEAKDAVKALMQENAVGSAGKTVVIEEYLCGSEISILAAVSVTPELAKEGKACIVPFESARDHKRLLDGARGPNTGGMGAICPVSDVTPLIQSQFEKNILQPTLNGLIQEGFDYRGFLFFGLMLTKDGPKCLEYNVRLGDPETQAVLPLLNTDFATLCHSIVEGTLKKMTLEWKKGYSVAPVAVSGGYPKSYKKGLPIFAPEGKLDGDAQTKTFIAGAIHDRRREHSEQKDYTSLVTSGGRVLACAAYADTFEQALKNAYTALTRITFEDMFYRKDIGLPGAAEST